MSATPPFLWHVPTRVMFGLRAVQEAGRCCREFADRALVVTDERLASETSIVQEVCSVLASAGVTPTLYDRVRPNPGLADVQRAMEALRESRSRLVVGLGGGSSMDVAKVVSAATRNPDLLAVGLWSGPEGWITPRLDRPRPPIPLVQIPTTASTSSEVNAVASLVVDETRRKKLLVCPQLLYARAAIVDPVLSVSVSARQTAGGGLETLMRVLVPYLTDSDSRVVQDHFSESIARVILCYTPRAMSRLDDLQAREALSSAVTNSTLSWTMAGRNPFGHVLWYLANTPTMLLGIPKAESMSALLSAYLSCLIERTHALPQLGSAWRLAAFGSKVLGIEGGEQEAARKTVYTLESLVRRWGLPTSLADIPLARNSPELPRHLAALTHEMWSSGPLDFMPEEQLKSFYEVSCCDVPTGFLQHCSC